MGFIIILQFVIKCFYVVPWTISALVYPLYASIRAIETDSASDFRKLVAYWILFSLTFLFEGAFVRLLEWLPFLWPYIKLVIFCWLVLSNFDGAYYVYKHVLHPCISLDVEDLINQFKERMEYFSTRIKVVAEEKRQEKENVGETLHELLKLLHETAANKSKGNEPINILQKNVKAFEATEKKEVAKAKQSKCEESINVVQKDMKSQSKCEDAINVVQKDMKAQLKCEEPINVVHKDMKAVEVAEKTEMAKQDGLKEHCVFLSENKKSEPEEIKRVSATTATRSEVSEIPVSNEVQQEWTCSLCQVTTPCEAILKLHLQGRQHKLCEEQLKAKNQPSKSKVSPVPEDKKSEDCEVPKQKPVQVQPDDQKYKCVELKGTLWCCTICNLTHGVLGFTMGSLWRMGTNWGLSIFLCTIAVFAPLFLEFLTCVGTFSRCNGVYYDILLLNKRKYTCIGVNIIPSMNVIYAIFGTLVILNCGFFVLLLHLLYTVFLTRLLGMRPSLKLPGWLEKAI